MKLYIKQKVFSWKEKFSVTDEQGNPRYFLVGELISLGKRLHIQDVNGNEVALIRQKVFTWLPKFFVEKGVEQIAEVRQKFSWFKPKFEVIGMGWNVVGDFFGHDYEIQKSGATIARIHKVWLSWGDSFEIEIMPGVDEISALAVIIAIDYAMDRK